jgi:hypothetical protein
VQSYAVFLYFPNFYRKNYSDNGIFFVKALWQAGFKPQWPPSGVYEGKFRHFLWITQQFRPVFFVSLQQSGRSPKRKRTHRNSKAAHTNNDISI